MTNAYKELTIEKGNDPWVTGRFWILQLLKLFNKNPGNYRKCDIFALQIAATTDIIIRERHKKRVRVN